MTPIYLAFIPKTKKINKSKKAIPIYIRLIKERKKVEARLQYQYDLTEEQIKKWDNVHCRLREKNSSINEYLDQLSARLAGYKRNHTFLETKDSLKEILAIVLGKEVSIKQHFLISYLNDFYKEEIENSNFKAVGTKVNYLKAINHLKTFLKFQNLLDIKIAEFTSVIAAKFKNYLESSHPELNKKINSPVSSSSNIKQLKPIFEKAISDGLILKNPFEKIKLSFESPLAHVLNIEQVRQIYNLDLSDKPALQFAKDFFLLCCFSGLSYTDAISLSKNDLTCMDNGRVKINTERNKTQKPIKQILLKYSIEIISKYKDFVFLGNESKLLPLRTGESINRSLKIIGAKANIPFDISTKTARITCSQLINEAGIENQLLIDSFMGWSSKNKIRSRYLHINDNSLIDFTQRFENYLNQYLIN